MSEDTLNPQEILKKYFEQRYGSNFYKNFQESLQSGNFSSLDEAVTFLDKKSKNIEGKLLTKPQLDRHDERMLKKIANLLGEKKGLEHAKFLEKCVMDISKRTGYSAPPKYATSKHSGKRLTQDWVKGLVNHVKKKEGVEVSCIIPTYQRKDTVIDSIESILNQKTKIPYELIIVDDGSTDGTTEFLRQKYGKRQNVKIITKENGGVASARNRGIEAASGKFITFLDADDCALSSSIRSLYNHLNKTKADMAHAKAIFVDEKGNPLDDGEHYEKGMPIGENYWNRVWTEVKNGRSSAEQILDEDYSPVHAQTVMVKRAVLDRVKQRDGHYFDEHLDFVEDFDLWRRIAETTGNISFLDELVSMYTEGTGNSNINPGRMELGEKAVKRKQEAKKRFGKNPGVLYLAGPISGCHNKILYERCRGLIERGMTQISVLSQPTWFAQGEKKYLSTKVTTSINNDDYINGDKNYFTDRQKEHGSLKEMLEAVNAGSYDAIHIIDNRWADEIDELKKLGKPIVFKLCSLIKHAYERDPRTGHLVAPIAGDKQGESVLQKQEKLLYASDMIEVETEEYKQIVLKHYPHLKDKIVVTQNSPDFSEQELAEIVNARENHQCIKNNRFLSVGRLDSVKGHEYTLEAFAEVLKEFPEAELDICGDSFDEGYKKKLFDIVDKSGIKDKVHFHGNVNKTRLKEFYKVARGYIQPSLHEQCSTTMLNAGRVGMTVIGSKIPEAGGMFNEDYKTGLMAELDYSQADGFARPDVKDLASKIKHIFKNPHDTYMIGQNAKKQLEEKGYTRDNVVDKVMQNYETVL